MAIWNTKTQQHLFYIKTCGLMMMWLKAGLNASWYCHTGGEQNWSPAARLSMSAGVKGALGELPAWSTH